MISTRTFLKFILFPLGLALIFTATLFQEGTALLQATPTPDRLAKPTLPPVATQADIGAQVYWLDCLPCHGDRGQGLTAEFRETYPEGEQYCWESGCHGKRPYDNGFTIPEYIPPVIGAGALQKFADAAQLRSYIFAAMPFWKPGSLPEEKTWQLTAFLLRENGLWDAGGELNASNASLILVGPPQATPTPEPVSPADSPAAFSYAPILVGLAAFFFVIFLLQFLRRK